MGLDPCWGPSGSCVKTDENWLSSISAWILLSLHVWSSLFRGEMLMLSLRFDLT